MSRGAAESSPLTFDLKVELLAKIEKIRSAHGFASTSAAVRAALDQFDFDSYSPRKTKHRQISVRLSLSRKRELVRISKQKGVSVGELLRVSLDNLSVRPGTGAASPKTKPDEPMKKKAKKAPKKKAAKKAKKK
jgi:Arc/MetJ-type ribon-helix-helix transcriptional regulator